MLWIHVSVEGPSHITRRFLTDVQADINVMPVDCDLTVHNLLTSPRPDVALVPAEKSFISKLRKFLSWIFSVYRLEHGCETFKFRVSQVDVAMSSCSLVSFSKGVRFSPIQKVIF